MIKDQRVLQLFKVSTGDCPVCYITDYSTDEAADQAKGDVAEVFDLNPNELKVEAISPIAFIQGKPAYQHILDCHQLVPQRVLEVM